MLYFAAVDGIAAELHAERSSHRGLRKAGIGAYVFASVSQAGPKSRAYPSGGDRRSGGDANRGKPRRNIVRDVINPCGSAPEVEVFLIAIADHRVEGIYR